MSPHVILFGCLMWSSCLYALWRGGPAERAIALIFLAAVALTHLAIRPQASRFLSVETGVLIVDLLAFCGYASVALASDRYWPMWFVGMMGVSLLSHLAILQPTMLPVVYWRAVTLWSYPRLILLAEAARLASSEQSGRHYVPFWALLMRLRPPTVQSAS